MKLVSKIKFKLRILLFRTKLTDVVLGNILTMAHGLERGGSFELGTSVLTRSGEKSHTRIVVQHAFKDGTFPPVVGLHEGRVCQHAD